MHLCVVGLLEQPVDNFDLLGFESGQTARVIELSGFGAIVVDVPDDYFVGEDAELRLQDPAWITPRALAHERILTEALQYGSVMPVPFATAFSSLSALVVQTTANRDNIDRFFRMTRGCAEHSVKALAHTTDAIAPCVERVIGERAEADAASLGEGLAYLNARKHRDAAKARAMAELTARMDEAAEPFDALSRDSADRRLGEAPDDWTALAHWAFLVPNDDASRFAREIERVNAAIESEGLRFLHHGPHPAYSFTPRG